MVDPRDVGRLIRFMRDEADGCSDERKSWFTATGDHLVRQRAEIEQLTKQRSYLKGMFLALDDRWRSSDELQRHIESSTIDEIGEDGFPPTRICAPLSESTKDNCCPGRPAGHDGECSAVPIRGETEKGNS